MTQPQSWLSGLPFRIDDPPTGSAGFHLDRDQAENMLETVTELEQYLRRQRNRAETLHRLTPPADDPASRSFNELAAGGAGRPGAFDYGIGHLDKEISYVAELRRRLHEALDRTAAGDHRARGTVTDVVQGAL